MGGASEKSATMLVLALTAALLPILIQLLAKMQQEIKQRKKEEAEREALTVAVASLRVRRHLDGRNHQDGEGAPKRRRRSRYQHDRATQAVEQDYFCLTPVFDDKQFERMYRIMKTMAQQLLNVCALTDPFFYSANRCL